jgi:hypothetical protein
VKKKKRSTSKEAYNPFKMPTDEEVFAMREHERQTKLEVMPSGVV